MKENVFGNNLKRLRKKKNLTQKDLGDLIHYSDKNISKWEQGKSLPEDDETIETLAKILEVDKKQLFEEHSNNFFKSKIFKIIFMNICAILIFLFIFFYFTRTKAYTIQTDNKNVFIENGNFIISNSYINFSINNVDTDSLEEIESIELYKYKNNNSDPILLHRTTSFPININENNVNKNVMRNLLKEIIILRINYKNNTEQNIKLTFKATDNKYGNEEKTRGRTVKENDLYSSSKSAEEYLTKIGFVKDSNSYVNYIDEDMYISYNKKSLIQYVINNKEYRKNYTLLLNNNDFSLTTISYEDGKTKTKSLDISKYKAKDCLEIECKSDEDYIGYLIFLKDRINSFEN